VKDLLLCLKGCNPQWTSTGYECSSCRVRKPYDAFYLKSNGGREAMCKKCRSGKALARHHAKRRAA
jgi:hypothetical protein